MKPLPAAIDPRPMGWMVVVQNFVGFERGGTKRKRLPQISRAIFDTKEEAEAHKQKQRARHPSPDCLICVTHVRIKPTLPKEKPKPAQHGPMDWNR